MKNKYNQRWLFVGVSHSTKKFRIPGIKISKLKKYPEISGFLGIQVFGFPGFRAQDIFFQSRSLGFFEYSQFRSHLCIYLIIILRMKIKCKKF